MTLSTETAAGVAADSLQRSPGSSVTVPSAMRQVLIAGALGALLIASSLTIRRLNIVTYHFFDVGPALAVYNLARIVAAIVFACAVMGAGRLFLCWFDRRSPLQEPLGLVDTCLAHIVAGLALLTIVGGVLGASSLLALGIVVPFVGGLAGCFVLCRPPSWAAFGSWRRVLAVAAGPSRLVLAFVAVLLLFMFLAKVIYPETFSGDSVGHYFPYMQKVSEAASSTRILYGWSLYGFFFGRGSGVSLLASVLTDGNGTRLASWLFMIGLVLCSLKLCLHMLPLDGPLARHRALGVWLPLVVQVPLVGYFSEVEFQKFHVQDYFLICAVFTLLASRLFESLDRARLYGSLIVILCAAMAVATPVTLYFAAAALVVWMVRGDFRYQLRFAVTAGSVVTVVLAVSWGYNYVATGMLDFVPIQVFFPLRNPAVFNQWFSPDAANFMTLTAVSTPTEYHALYWRFLPYSIAACVLSFGWQWHEQRQTGRPWPRSLVRLFWTVAAASAMYVPMLIVVALVSSGPSFDRFLGFQVFFRYVIFCAGLISAMELARRLFPYLYHSRLTDVWRRPRERLAEALSWSVLFGLVVLCGVYFVRVPYRNMSHFAGRDAANAVAAFALGRLSYADTVSPLRTDFRFCRMLEAITPANARILQITAAANEVCVHVSTFAERFPYYAGDWGAVLYGNPAAAAVELRKAGFNYFYLDASSSRQRFDDIHVFAPIFQYPGIGDYFDVYWESDERYLLTWKGFSGAPVDSRLALRFTSNVQRLFAEGRGYSYEYLAHKKLRESGAKW